VARIVSAEDCVVATVRAHVPVDGDVESERTLLEAKASEHLR
jgi:hypothetical protein